MVPGCQVKQNIDIIQTNIRIKYQNAFPLFRQGVCQVGYKVGFAHPTFATTDGQDLGKFWDFLVETIRFRDWA